MKKKLFITFAFGLLIGALYFGGPFVLAAIQSQVGINTLNTSTRTWNPVRDVNLNELGSGNGILATGLYIRDSVGDWNRAISIAAETDDSAGAGAQSTSAMLFDGTTFDRQRSVQGSIGGLFTGVLSTQNMLFGAGGSPSQPYSLSALTFPSENVPASGLVLNDSPSVQTATLISRSTGYVDPCLACATVPIVPWFFDGTNQTKQRSISAANLTATTSVGSPINVPLSTWSVTNTPGAAAQATASKALGGGTVRHVATSITACSAQLAAAQTPIAINLRDGATGAGTVLRTWKISSIIQDSKCIEASGLAMIGTANTAMTIEFAAAGVAGSEQTVTLTGFSVP